MNIYTTIQGQTWDEIAYEVLGSEFMCDKIMNLNRDKLDIFVFPDGVRIMIPDKESVVRQSVPTDYPAWRALLNED